MKTDRLKTCRAVGMVFCLAFSGAAHAETSREARVDAGGHKLHIRVMGEGSPTVILESGEGGKIKDWARVQSGIARFTRALVYDRAGVGKSEEGPNPRHSRRIAQELHALLKSAGLSPPYVLAGHSAGGLHIRVFAHTYPDEVAGMVFVDPTTEYILEDRELLGSLQAARKFEGVGGGRPSIRVRGKAFLLPKFSAEFSAMMTSAEQARDAWPLPDVPMILITARRAPRGLEHRSQIKLGYHQALIAQMPKATHVIAEKSGHLSQKDEPERVIQAVLQVVEEARAGHPGGGLPEKGVDTRHP